jgi:hypothetical protein
MSSSQLCVAMSPGTSGFPARLGGYFLPPPENGIDAARLAPPLATLRSQFSELAITLAKSYGANSVPRLRAEQVIAALQRLELSFDL